MTVDTITLPRAAAQGLLDDLHARIDSADLSAVPMFPGLAELNDALKVGETPTIDPTPGVTAQDGVEAWDHRYRPLAFGEIIEAGDECRRDDGTWVTGIFVGGPAPDPAYTSHRVYRRLKSTPTPTIPAGMGEDQEVTSYHKLIADRAEALESVKQEYRWGNLTRLGVSNHLIRAGFSRDYALREAEKIAAAFAPKEKNQ